RAQQLDPLSVVISSAAGTILYCARRHDESIQAHRSTLELEPDFLLSRAMLGMACVERGRMDEGIAEMERGRNSSPNSSLGLGTLGYGYARAGRVADAERVVADLGEMGQRMYVSSFWTGLV